MRHRVRLLTAWLVLALPGVALANVGTPLMWVGGLYLLFGNFVIGVLEGLLIGRVFRVPYGRAVGLMLPANVISAWIGSVWVLPEISSRVTFDLENVGACVAAMGVAALLLTLALEWPFVALCLRDKHQNRKWLRRSLAASVLAQGVSYALLAGVFWTASGTTFLTEVTVVPADELPLPAEVTVYYIDDASGDVRRLGLPGGAGETFAPLGSRDPLDCLAFVPSSGTAGRWELAALLDSGTYGDPRVEPLGLTFAAASIPSDAEGAPDRRARDFRGGYQEAPRLPPAQGSDWTIETNMWPYFGLIALSQRPEASWRCALETPFVAWRAQRATQLDSRRVLFQFGDRQICVLDVESRRLARVAIGRGPVAVWNGPPESTASAPE